MTDDHKVVNRRRSVNNVSTPRSLAVGPTACIQHDCIHVGLVQRSAVLTDTDIRLIVKITQSVRRSRYSTQPI